MRRKKNFAGVVAVLAVVAVSAAMECTRAFAQTEETLYSFSGSPTSPSGVIIGPGGSLYGRVDPFEGVSSIYELSPSNGGWAFSILSSGLYDGAATDTPPPLIADASGNLYGTDYHDDGGDGLVYELSPSSDGSWTLQTLYAFSAEGGKNGQAPTGPLAMDSAGNLYGTTQGGGHEQCDGRGGCGTVFELIRGQGGTWTEKVLYAFGGPGDGVGPLYGVIFDAAGNLYGTTFTGGLSGGDYGTVFELSPEAGGVWKERILHRFDWNGKDGYQPISGLVLDAAGNLYGTTSSGGAFGANGYGGTIFELSPTLEGGWSEKILHNCLNPHSANGECSGQLISDASGNLYGVSHDGGDHVGAVYELSPSAGGKWIQNSLYSFSKENGQPYYPVGALQFDSAGNIYGTTGAGGANGQGAIYEITP
jgi:uncharacterized repeat protein (TIGR03803 family)